MKIINLRGAPLSVMTIRLRGFAPPRHRVISRAFRHMVHAFTHHHEINTLDWCIENGHPVKHNYNQHPNRATHIDIHDR